MKNKLFWLIALISWVILAVINLYPIIVGNIPFWYDPARDMLSAWDNLHKLTLIGSTSGIPGIFYGPYWIWLLRPALGNLYYRFYSIHDFSANYSVAV
jgi:hypothetical protein